jgi:carbon monoxide dehydrogenase subunit G
VRAACKRLLLRRPLPRDYTASIRKEISTSAQPDDVWERIRDIGALHTRLVPGFVLDTRLEGRARWVTFANGIVAKERIVTSDDEHRRFVWSADARQLGLEHYNASVQVFPSPKGSQVVWVADLLPDEAAPKVAAMIEEGMSAMQKALGS